VTVSVGAAVAVGSGVGNRLEQPVKANITASRIPVRRAAKHEEHEEAQREKLFPVVYFVSFVFKSFFPSM